MSDNKRVLEERIATYDGEQFYNVITDDKIVITKSDKVSSFIKNLLGYMHVGTNVNTSFIAQIVINLAVCSLVPNILNIIIFFKTSEFKDLYAVAKSFTRRKK